MVQGIGNIVDKIVQLMAMWDSANAKMGGKLGMLMNPVNAGASLLGKAMGFASGGIVTQPTLGMVGEAGPEAIIPLSQMGNMGGGGVTVNVGNFMGDDMALRQFTREVQRILDEENRRTSTASTKTGYYSAGGHL
jgi:hypothetical protein